MFSDYKCWLKLRWLLIYHRLDYFVDWIHVKFHYMTGHRMVNVGKDYRKPKKTLQQKLDEHKVQVLKFELMVREYYSLCKRLDINPHRTELIDAVTTAITDYHSEYRKIDAVILLVTSQKIRKPLYDALLKLGDISPSRVNSLKETPQSFYNWLNEL